MRASCIRLSYTVAFLACMVGLAEAGVNHGGTLIVAMAEGIIFSDPPPETFCGSSAAQDCDDAAVRHDGTDIVILNVLAAFNPLGSPRLAGVTFGLDYDDTEIFIPSWQGGAGWGSCGDFALWTDNWPAPNEGVAVTWSEAQTGHLTEVFWFLAYNYYGNPNTFCLTGHPQGGGAFADDSWPSELDVIADLGCFGFSTDGVLVCPEAVPVGACCYNDAACDDFLVQSDCESSGGEYGGDGSSCHDPGFCEGVTYWACCVGDLCTETTQSQCSQLGGTYLPGSFCEDLPCDATPTIESSWGKIKLGYR